MDTPEDIINDFLAPSAPGVEETRGLSKLGERIPLPFYHQGPYLLINRWTSESYR